MKKSLKILPILFASAIISNAQSLPNKQEKSVWAPANIKIDGKASEWDGKFEAFNHATEIWYTIANDKNNLYLVVQATEPDVIRKIIGRGLTLTVEAPGKKNDKNSASVTYPLTGSSNGGIIIVFGDKKGVVPDTSLQGRQTIMRIRNETLGAGKYIGISGIKELDTLISAYNEDDGIRAAEQFNIKGVYTFELSVKLDHLRQYIQSDRLTYHIRLNGGLAMLSPGTPTAPDATPAQVAAIASMDAQINQHAMAIRSPTDFWGEYTLAKKP